MMLPVLPALMAEHRPGTSGSAAGTSAEGDGGTSTGPGAAGPSGNWGKADTFSHDPSESGPAASMDVGIRAGLRRAGKRRQW